LKLNIRKTTRKRKLYLTYENGTMFDDPKRVAHGLSTSTELLVGHVSVGM